MAVILRCPVCRGKFRWEAKEPWPEYCQIEMCREYIGIAGKDEVVMPFISLSKRKSADKVFRDMEKGAEHRINVAAEMTGQPKSDFNSLKMTDMKDNLRPGDISAPELPANPVSQQMQMMQARGMPVGFGSGVDHSGAVQSGPAPNAGAKMRSVIRSMHSEKMGWPVSDMPALETLQPGYRSRA